MDFTNIGAIFRGHLEGIAGARIGKHVLQIINDTDTIIRLLINDFNLVRLTDSKILLYCDPASDV